MAAPRPLPLKTRVSIDVAMTLLALASVGIVVYELLVLTSEPRLWLDVLDLVIVLVFLFEFVWSARRSGDWKQYVKSNWYDIPGMIWIPGTVVEYARGLRLLRLVRLLRLLRLVRAAARVRRLLRHAGGFAERARVVYIAFVAAGTVFIGGLAAYLLESPSNALFRTPWDGLWWALVTTATVGYGDIYPVTVGGRAVAAVLMVVGVGVIGALAGSLGAALLSPPEEEASGRKRVVSRWHR